jgi:hypothetical protein
MDVAGRFHVSFIAGLVLNENAGPKPPHSAAYLIDETKVTLMGYKVGPDDTVGVNYTERVGRADFENPVRYLEVWVGALICVDGHFPQSMSKLLRDRREKVVNLSRVVCLPVHMAKGNLGDGKSGSHVPLTSGWANKTLILANSNPRGIDSFITDSTGIILEPTVGGLQNRIVTLPLA